MSKSKMPGLILKRGIWQIDKIINGQRLCESTRETEYAKAERYAIQRINEINQNRNLTSYTFNQAAANYIETEEKKSLDRDIRALNIWVPLIGHMLLEEIHMESLKPYTNKRLETHRSGTVIRELAVIRHILMLASRMWRNQYNQPWLQTAPLLSVKSLSKMRDKKKPYPLSWNEQDKLFSLLPSYLAEAALFKVNTGTREQEVCGLRWRYEVPVQDTSVFIIPEDEIKNSEDRVVILNKVAKSVIESRRGKHPEYVFSKKGERIRVLNCSSWGTAWRKAGLPINDIYSKGVHNLKHTFGMRLRQVGVSHESRQVLLGHTNGNITTHYSAAQYNELMQAADKVLESRQTPDFSILKLKHLGN